MQHLTSKSRVQTEAIEGLRAQLGQAQAKALALATPTPEQLVSHVSDAPTAVRRKLVLLLLGGGEGGGGRDDVGADAGVGDDGRSGDGGGSGKSLLSPTKGAACSDEDMQLAQLLVRCAQEIDPSAVKLRREATVMNGRRRRRQRHTQLAPHEGGQGEGGSALPASMKVAVGEGGGGAGAGTERDGEGDGEGDVGVTGEDEEVRWLYAAVEMKQASLDAYRQAGVALEGEVARMEEEVARAREEAHAQRVVAEEAMEGAMRSSALLLKAEEEIERLRGRLRRRRSGAARSGDRGGIEYGGSGGTLEAAGIPNRSMIGATLSGTAPTSTLTISVMLPLVLHETHGTTLVLSMSGSTTISDLKTQIAAITGMGATDQQLSFRGAFLTSGSQSLSSAGITSGSKIALDDGSGGDDSRDGGGGGGGDSGTRDGGGCGSESVRRRSLALPVLVDDATQTVEEEEAEEDERRQGGEAGEGEAGAAVDLTDNPVAASARLEAGERRAWERRMRSLEARNADLSGRKRALEMEKAELAAELKAQRASAAAATSVTLPPSPDADAQAGEAHQSQAAAAEMASLRAELNAAKEQAVAATHAQAVEVSRADANAVLAAELVSALEAALAAANGSAQATMHAADSVYELLGVELDSGRSHGHKHRHQRGRKDARTASKHTIHVVGNLYDKYDMGHRGGAHGTHPTHPTHGTVSNAESSKSGGRSSSSSSSSHGPTSPSLNEVEGEVLARAELAAEAAEAAGAEAAVAYAMAASQLDAARREGENALSRAVRSGRSSKSGKSGRGGGGGGGGGKGDSGDGSDAGSGVEGGGTGSGDGVDSSAVQALMGLAEQYRSQVHAAHKRAHMLERAGEGSGGEARRSITERLDTLETMLSAAVSGRLPAMAMDGAEGGGEGGGAKGGVTLTRVVGGAEGMGAFERLERIPLSSVRPGDVLRLTPMDVLPFDGTMLAVGAASGAAGGCGEGYGEGGGGDDGGAGNANMAAGGFVTLQWSVSESPTTVAIGTFLQAGAMPCAGSDAAYVHIGPIAGLATAPPRRANVDPFTVGVGATHLLTHTHAAPQHGAHRRADAATNSGMARRPRQTTRLPCLSSLTASSPHVAFGGSAIDLRGRRPMSLAFLYRMNASISQAKMRADVQAREQMHARLLHEGTVELSARGMEHSSSHSSSRDEHVELPTL